MGESTAFLKLVFGLPCLMALELADPPLILALSSDFRAQGRGPQGAVREVAGSSPLAADKPQSTE